MQDREHHKRWREALETVGSENARIKLTSAGAGRGRRLRALPRHLAVISRLICLPSGSSRVVAVIAAVHSEGVQDARKIAASRLRAAAGTRSGIAYPPPPPDYSPRELAGSLRELPGCSGHVFPDRQSCRQQTSR